MIWGVDFACAANFLHKIEIDFARNFLPYFSFVDSSVSVFGSYQGNGFEIKR